MPIFKNEIKDDMQRKKESEINLDRYNPITNPIPWMNQNPYIKKDKTNLRSSASISNIFS